MSSVIRELLPLALLAFVLAWGVTWLVHRHALRLRLVQAPNHRSSHVQLTPHGGGIGIVVAGAFVALLATGNAEHGVVLMGMAVLIAVIGLCDDIFGLSARLRFAVQLLLCGGALWIFLPQLPALPLPGGVQLQGGWLFLPALLVGVWWINLFNFMDGIDGIAATQAMFMLLGAALVGVLEAADPASVMAGMSWQWLILLAAAGTGFLLHNWSPARIFMGDVGSTFLAFLVLALALASIAAGWMTYAGWLILAAVFVSDATVTLLRRTRAGQKWSEAHRSHAYQRLSRRWGVADRARGHRRVCLLAGAINLIWLLPLALVATLAPAYALVCVLAAYLPVLAGVWKAGAGLPD